MTIGQYCNRATVIINQSGSIREAAQLMREQHVGSLVVVEEHPAGFKPIGILTDRDLVVEIMAAGLDPETVSVGDIMSFEVISCREDAGLWETLQRMRFQGVRRTPVVNTEGFLVGVLSTDDLLELLAGELGDLAKIVSRERSREERKRGEEIV